MLNLVNGEEMNHEREGESSEVFHEGERERKVRWWRGGRTGPKVDIC